MGFNTNDFISPLFKFFGKKLANVPPSPINNDVAVFNGTTEEWELQQIIIGSAVQSSSNVGSGAGLALPRVLDDLPFKTLVDGVEIVITVSATELTFSIGTIAISKISGLQVELDSKIETITNVGTGAGIAKPKIGTNVDLKSLIAINDLSIIENTDDITLDAIKRRPLFTQKRQYSLFPEEAENINAVMLGAGDLTEEGDQTPFLDIDGYYIQNMAVGGMGASEGGYFIIDSLRGDLDFDVTIKFRANLLATSRYWFGFFTADPMLLDLPVTQHLGLRLSSSAGNVNFVVSHADGITQAETQVGLADLLIHTIRFKSDGVKFQYEFDGGGLVDVTTNIPVFTTDLDLFLEVEDTLGAGLSNFDFWFVDGEANS